MNRKLKNTVLIGTMLAGLAFTLPVNAESIALSDLNTTKNQAEKAKIETNKQDLNKQDLVAEIEKLQASITVLKGQVTAIEENEKNKKLWGFNYGEDFKVTGGLQTVFYGNIQKGDHATPSNFSLPWGEINFTGKMHEHVDYKAKLVPTRRFDNTTAGSLLEDAYFKTDIIPHHDVYLGQTAVPFGIEAAMSPMDVDFIEYSQIANSIGQGYDSGVKTEGNWGLLNYKAGVYNGNGRNTTDTKRGMTLVSQATIKPFHKNPELGDLQLGGSWLDGSNASNNLNGYGAHASYALGKFTVKGEYMTLNGSTQSANRGEGWYTDVKYQHNDKLQLLSRVDIFDPHSKINSDATTAYTLGSNYLFTQNLLLMVNYSYIDSKTGKDSNRLGLMTQVMF